MVWAASTARAQPAAELGSPSEPPIAAAPGPPVEPALGSADWLVAPLSIAIEMDLAGGRFALAAARATVVIETLPAGSPLRVRAEGQRVLALDRVAPGGRPPPHEEVLAPLVFEAEMDLARGRPDLTLMRLDFALRLLPPQAPLTARALAVREAALRAAAPPAPIVAPSIARAFASPGPIVPIDPTERGTGELVELCITLGAWGGLTGAYVPYVASEASAAPVTYVLSVPAGAAIGVVGALAMDVLGPPLRTGVPVSMSVGLRSGLGLGALSIGLLESTALDPQAAFSLAWGGMTLGGAIGAVVGLTARPSIASLRFVESGGWWGLGIGAAIAAMTNFEHRNSGFALMVAGMGTGLVVNASLALASVVPSVGRTFWLSLGFAAGAGVGSLVPAILQSNPMNDVDPIAFGIPMLIGAVAGWTLALILTEGRDAHAPSVRVSLSPSPGGVSLGVAGEM